MITRRNFLGGMIAACAAPAIVRAESLMKIAVPDQRIYVANGIETIFPFGYSPIISTLPDAKTLNQMVNDKLRHEYGVAAGKRLAEVADREMMRIMDCVAIGVQY